MTEQTLVTDVIVPDGYTVRPAEMSDNDAVVRLYNANRIKSVGEAIMEDDEFTQIWSDEKFDLVKSSRVIFAPDGQLAAYVSVAGDNKELPISPYISGCVHPDFEGNGLGSAMLTWGIERAKQVIPRCPENARVSTRTGIYGEYEPAKNLLADFGFEVSRRWYTMRIERQENPPEPQIPEGITIRPIRYPDELEAVVRADDAAFRDHYGYVEQPFEEQLQDWKQWIENDKEFDPDLWFVAVDDSNGEFAGVCLCRHMIDNKPERALVDSLGVLPAYRKRGLGMALLQFGFNALWARGKEEVVLGVDATSITGATRLYEKAGMSVFKTGKSLEIELRPGEELRRTS